MRFLFLAFGLLALTGCAFTPQEAVIKPEVTVVKTATGGSKQVQLDVVDERSGTVIGNRSPAGGAEIRLIEVTSVIEPRVRDALIVNEFQPAERRQATDRRLKIEVRAVELKTAGGWTAAYLPRAALKAVATNNGQVFERLYRAEIEQRVVVANPESQNNQLLSQVVSKALSDLVNDPELMGFLAR